MYTHVSYEIKHIGENLHNYVAKLIQFWRLPFPTARPCMHDLLDQTSCSECDPPRQKTCKKTCQDITTMLTMVDMLIQPTVELHSN